MPNDLSLTHRKLRSFGASCHVDYVSAAVVDHVVDVTLSIAVKFTMTAIECRHLHDIVNGVEP